MTNKQIEAFANYWEKHQRKPFYHEWLPSACPPAKAANMPNKPNESNPVILFLAVSVIVAIPAICLAGGIEFCLLNFSGDAAAASIRADGVWLKLLEISSEFWVVGMGIIGIGWLMSQCDGNGCGGSCSKDIEVKINGDSYKGTVTKVYES